MHLFSKRDEVTRACSPFFRYARASSHGRPLSVRPLVRPEEKFGSHIYRHIRLMNHLKTHQTNLMANRFTDMTLEAPMCKSCSHCKRCWQCTRDYSHLTFERLGTTPNLFAGLMSGYAHLRALAPPSSPANKRSTKGKMSEHTFGTQRKQLKKYIVSIVRMFVTPFLVSQYPRKIREQKFEDRI